MNAKRWIMLMLLALFPLFAGAVPLTSFPAAVNGELSTSDTLYGEFYSDAYEVAVVPGQTLTIDMTSTSFDTFLYMLDAQGNLVADNNHYSGSTRASRIIHTATASGTLYIYAESYYSYATGSYTLSVQSSGAQQTLTPPQTVSGALASTDAASVSRPGGRADHYQISLQAGQTIVVDHASTAFDAYLAILDSSRAQVLASNDDYNGLDSRITFTAQSAGTYFIEATALSTSVTAGSYTLSVQSSNAQQTLTPPQTVSGALASTDAASVSRPGGRADHYQISLQAGQTIVVDHASTAFDAYLAILDSSRTQVLASNDDYNSLNSRITFTAQSAGTYFIEATALSTSVTAGSYTLSVQSSSTTTVDTQAPTVPGGLTVSQSGSSQVNLGWTASADNVGVSAYRIYQNGALVATLGNVTSHSVSGLVPGSSYSFTVSACDAANNCSAQSAPRSLTLIPTTVNLTASFTASTLNGTAPLAVNFTGQGTSSLATDTLSYSWNFGDGQTSTERNPSHTYTTAGAYTVVLTVSNANGQSQTSSGQTITVTQPNANLTASFTASTLNGTAPLAVTFTGQGSSSLATDTLSFSWNFGDGQTSTERNPSHSYTAAGTYTVMLTVSNANGQSQTSSGQTITVTQPVASLAASFTASAVTGTAPLAVTFTGQGTSSLSTDTLSYSWDFGDGQSSTERNPSHTYTTAGTYTVALTVSNALGQSVNSTSRTITVSRGNITVTGKARLRPQVIMGGFDPILLNLADDSFKLMAVVRPGASNIAFVQTTNNAGGFSVAMNYAGTYDNGDQLYEVLFTYPRGSFPNNMVLGDLFGTAAAEFQMSVVDGAQNRHSFPHLEFGNNTQLSTRPVSPGTQVSSAPGTRRPLPQVLAAGFDPQLVDLEDTSFDVVAIVRAGLVPIRSVSISTNNGGFALAMNPVETLPNGDQKYRITYTYPRGTFPQLELGDLFGTDPNEFNIVVTDEAHQTHRFPELRSGNYPAQ